ncbi:aspartate aminotransferase family protein [Paenibacillus sp. KN14-4R]|uniref:aspartate aminotransferase family protein n=1 Tax=Paenibacillus sp. KN14-4R TaxID=3445773 RepID=UPI003FA10546
MTYIGPDGILAKRKAYFYPCTAHFYKQPPQLVRGSMQYLYDEHDKQYVDFFAGVSVVACGHCNPQITSATIKQLQQLQHTTTIYLTQPMVDLSEKMASVLPDKLNRTFFCNSGSEANEGAMLLARLHTGKKEFIALENGLHGRTFLTMGVTGIPMWRADNSLDSIGVSFIPRPYDEKLTPEQAATHSLEVLKQVLEEKGDQIAAMIVEPIQGNGGIIVPVDWYFLEVKKLLNQYHVLLIADEIQTGFGRTGKMFAMEHFDVVPDIMTMAKALGNGVPISCFASTDQIAASFTKPSASTFGGNPVSSVTALAVLDYIEQENLADRAASLGTQMKEQLLQMKQKFSIISDVRGLGLMIGMEMCADDPAQGAVVVDQILETMKDRGFIIGKNGIHRNVIAFQPPLVLTEADINNMLSALDETLYGL